MNLLEECIDALLKTKNKCEILPIDEGKIFRSKFFETYPFERWGRISWDGIENKSMTRNIEEIPVLLEQMHINYSSPVYIIWGDSSLPVVKSELKDILQNIDEVTPLGVYGTWLYCPSEGWVIEFHHHGEITIGFAKK